MTYAIFIALLYPEFSAFHVPTELCSADAPTASIDSKAESMAYNIYTLGYSYSPVEETPRSSPR